MTGKINPFPASEYALLGFLLSGPCHGYELHKRMTDETGIGLVWGVKISNLYAQLDKLEHKGLIRGLLQPGEQRPARMEYSLTLEGKEVIEDWLTQIVEHPRDLRQEFMVRFFFLARIHPDMIEGIIQAQLKVCEEWINIIQNKEETSSQAWAFPKLIYHFRSLQIQSILDWLRWLQDQLPISSQNGGIA